MMSSRVHAKQRDVQSMRHPRERMPIGLLGGSGGPRNGVSGQSLTDVGVLSDVTVVVVINEGMVVDWVVESQSYDRQQQAHDRVALFSGREQAGRFRLECRFGF